MNNEEMAQEIERLTALSTKLAEMLSSKIDENTLLKENEKSLWYEIDYLSDALNEHEIELDPGAFNESEAQECF